MISLIICPECQKQVSVPEATHESAQVRCPLCEAEFELASAIPEDVPQLTVVDPGMAAVREQPAAGEAKSDDDFGFQFGGMAEGSGDSIAFETMDETDEDDTERTDASGEGELGLMAPDADEEHAAAGGFDFGAGDDTDADESDSFGGGGDSAATATAAAPKKKKRKGPGFLGQMVGVVVFGVVGLGLGYGILKMVKPSAAKPIDNMLEPAWTAVTSLWPSADEGADAGADAGDDSGDFAVGGMLPGQGTPGTGAAADAGLTTGAGFDATKKLVDDGSADAGDDFGIGDDDLWLPGDDKAGSQPNGDKLRVPFAPLLGGQADSSGVLKVRDASQIADAVAAAQESVTAASGKLAPIYFAMCDLGDQIAFLSDSPAQRAEAARMDAEDLVRQVVDPAMYPKMAAFSNQWMQVDRRPKAHQSNTGVFLVGKIKLVVPFGELFATEMELVSGDSSTRITVLSGQRPSVHVGDRAAVLGSLVRDAPPKLLGYDPSQGLEKFKSDTSQIILAGATVKLPKQ